MEIQSVGWSNNDRTILVVNNDTFVPWPCNTWHKSAIQAWLDAGNEPEPVDPSTIVKGGAQ